MFCKFGGLWRGKTREGGIGFKTETSKQGESELASAASSTGDETKLLSSGTFLKPPPDPTDLTLVFVFSKHGLRF